MAEVAKFPGPTIEEIECIKSLKKARMVASECIDVLEALMRDDTISPGVRIEAVRTLLYYGLEWEITNNG